MNNKVKINLGSGNDYKKGWVNIDAIDNGQVDLIADLNKKFPFNDNTIDEIFASDILEHFTKEDGERFLEECWRVLKATGVITIRTHDVYKIFRKFYSDPWVVNHFVYGDTSATGVYGAHKYSYNRKSITYILNSLGFEVVFIKDEETNICVRAKKIIKSKKNLSIGIIMQSPDYGGAEEHMLNLISEFKKNGHKISVATNEGRYFDYLNSEIKDVKSIPVYLDIIGNLRGLFKTFLLLPYALFFYIKLLNYYKKKNVDIILLSNFTEKLLVSILSIFYKIPVVWIEYGPLKSILKRNYYIPKILYRALINIPRKIIVPSENTLKDLLFQSRASLSKFLVVPCGIIVNEDLPKGSSKKNIVVGNVSRQAKEKGQDYLIDAIPLILKKNSNIKFLFVGDGPDLNRYKEKVRKLNIEKFVEFTGFVKSVDKYYSKMNIFVFTSDWELEGFGLVAIEAMNRRVPVIGNNFGPIKEVLDNGTGILVDIKDKKELASAVLDLANNSIKRKDIGYLGYRKASDAYNIKKIVKIYEDIFYNVSCSDR